MVDGKRVSKSFRTRSEAWVWVEAVEAGLEPLTGRNGGNGRTGTASTKPSGGGPSLRQFVDGGGFVVAHLRPSTKSTYKSLVRVLTDGFGDTPLAEITHEQFQCWILEDARYSEKRDRLTGERKVRSEQSVRHIAKVAHGVFAAAQRQGVIEVNPAKGVKVARDARRYEPRFLTKEELLVLADAMKPEYAVFVYLAGFGGLRSGEIFGLRWRNVDVAAGRVTVAESASLVNGATILDEPKSKRSKRTLTLPAVARDALKQHRDNVFARQESARGFTPSPDEFVIQNPDGTPMNRSTFRHRAWTHAVDASGVGHLRAHELRHTAVSLWIAAGMNPKEVSVRAGHESVAFTLDRYGHLYDDADLNGTAKFDAYLNT
jgi:integrase